MEPMTPRDSAAAGCRVIVSVRALFGRAHFQPQDRP